MSGGQSWTKEWRIRGKLVQSVKITEMLRRQLLCILGIGRINPGVLSRWIMRDRSWEKCFFVLRDAHSKWMDVYPVNSATSATTIECLRTSFSNHGLPELLVSDNNRVTPQTTTGLSPAELLLGRKLRCTLDLIHLDLNRKVLKRQEQQSRDHDSRAKKTQFRGRRRSADP